MQVLSKKVKRSLSINGMPSIEVFNGGSVRNAELIVETLHFGIFESDPFIHADAIAVTSLHRKGTHVAEVEFMAGRMSTAQCSMPCWWSRLCNFARACSKTL